MTRLSQLTEEQLTPEQQVLYQTIAMGPRGATGLVGPFNAYLRAPQAGDAAQALGSTVRFGTRVAENVKEVAICTVGAFYKAKFEFAAHAKLAIKAGVDKEIVEALRLNIPPAFAKEAERLAYTLAYENLIAYRVSDATYREALACFGEEQLVELILTIGYYSLVSMTLNTFEIPLRDGMVDPFPEWR